MENALGLAGEQFAFPKAGTVEIDRHVVRVVRRTGLRTDHRRNQQYLLAVASEVYPAQTMDGRDAVDLQRCPWLPGVWSALKDKDITDAFFRHSFEVVAHRDFRNAVAVVIVDVEIDGARHILDQYVTLPSWIFEPREFRASFVYDDEVRSAVTVQVSDYQLITHF